MPRFFFDVFNGRGDARDDEGLDLESQAAARRVAVDSVRSIVAEEARDGVIDLHGRIEVKDGVANLLLTVDFAEAFELHLPGPDGRSGR